MIPLNYHHLFYFYTIARAGSISGACGTLLLAQSTLSAQLKQFESSLGRRLFERRNRSLVLTEEGRMVLDYAESIFGTGRELQAALRDQPSRGRIAAQVGILSGTPRAFGHALLERLLKDPALDHVVVREGTQDELVAGLRQQRLDAVLSDVSIRSGDRDEFVNRLIGKVPVVLAAAPRLAARCRRIPADLAGLPFILPSLPSQVYHQVQDAMESWGVRFKVVAEVQDVELARRLAISGHGIVPINEYTVASGLPAGGLRIIKGSRELGVRESVYIITRRRKRPNPLVERLVEGFAGVFRRMR